MARVNYEKMIPKAAIDFLVGRYHVGTSDQEIAEDIKKRGQKNKWPAGAVTAAAKYAIKRHHANQKMYGDVMGGRIRNNPDVSEKAIVKILMKMPAESTRKIRGTKVKRVGYRVFKIGLDTMSEEMAAQVIKWRAAGGAQNNPGPYYAGPGRYSFDTGNTFRFPKGVTRSKAARYLDKVKAAEHAGRKVPAGPEGVSPADAAVIMHYGPQRAPRAARRAKKKACVCPPKRRKRAAAPRTRPAPARRRRTRPAPVSRPRTAPISDTAATTPVDFIDYTADIYGGF